jgi:trimeric autotransporter adhesin
MISFFKKIIFLAIVLALSLYASMSHAQSTVRPDLAPILSNPTPANCEFYTQKGGTPIKRVPLDILMNTLSPKAVPTPALAYVPTASGNPVNDRNKIVIGANGITYYIDPNGAGIVLGGAGAGYTAGTGISVSGNVITNVGDLSTTNEIQTLSKIGSGTLKLTKGAAASNYIILPDSSASNEMQTLSIVGDSLSISGRNKIQLPSGLVYTGGSGISVSGSVISAVDASTTNELQTISISGQDLSITGGNTITLPTATNYTAGTGITIVANAINNTGDLSDTNEAQTISNNITASNPTVSLSAVSGSGGGTVQFVAGGGIGIAGANSPNRVIVTAEDPSLTNEIQTLTRPTAGTIRLQNTQALGHNLVYLPDSSSTNEIQTLSKTTAGTYKLTNGVSASTFIVAADSSATNEIELPTQTGNIGKYLSTNGTAPSWVNPPSGADNWGSQTVNVGADFAGDGGPSAPLELTTTSGLAGTYNNVTVSATGRVTAGSNATYMTSEVDGSITNEIQTFSKPTTGTLKLTNGAAASTFIALPDSSAINEIELPSLTGHNGEALLVNGAATEWGVVDRSATNEIQTLSLPNTGTIRLTNPGFASTFITLPDSSATNEIELPSQATHSGKFLSTNGTTASWTAEVDGSTTNELQTLVWNGAANTLGISSGNTVTITTTPDLSTSSDFTGNGSTGSPLTLSNTGVSANTYNNVTVNSKGRVTAASNVGYLTSEVDGSVTNEIQSLSLTGNLLSISGVGGSVTLPTGTTYTAGTGINISGGNVISAPLKVPLSYFQTFGTLNIGSAGQFEQVKLFFQVGESYTLLTADCAFCTLSGHPTGTFTVGGTGINTIAISAGSGQTGVQTTRGATLIYRHN